MKITAEPRSDQWNADDFVGGSRTFTIAGVKVGTAEQKYDIELAEGEGRSWRPPLTMLRLLIAAWGDEAAAWTGRRVTLYRDESVRFGPDAVGGIRISHMSDLPGNKPFTDKFTSMRGRRSSLTVQPLPDDQPAPVKQPTPAGIIKAFDDLGVSVAQLEARVGAPAADWSVAEVATLAALGKAIKAGETTVADAFQAADDSQMAMNTTDEES